MSSTESWPLTGSDDRSPADFGEMTSSDTEGPKASATMSPVAILIWNTPPLPPLSSVPYMAPVVGS